MHRKHINSLVLHLEFMNINILLFCLQIFYIKNVKCNSSYLPCLLFKFQSSLFHLEAPLWQLLHVVRLVHVDCT